MFILLFKKKNDDEEFKKVNRQNDRHIACFPKAIESMNKLK